MLKAKKYGDWDQLARLFRSRRKRIDRMSDVLLRDLAKRFKEDVASRLPSGSDMKHYVEAIQTRRLEGSFKKGEIGYALIVDHDELEMASLNKARTVVYAVRRKDVVGDLAGLLIEMSPWIVDRMPVNIPSGEVKLHHRDVTEDEVDRLRKRSDLILKERGEELKKAGARFKRTEEDPDPPKSMPDVAFKALRMEFGIKHRRVRHWGYAVGQVGRHLTEMLRGGGEYRKYIADPYFTEWNSPMTSMDKMTVQEFKKKYLDFQKKVAK